jgi:YegS/Rv2252/BmrU family lipid kinase
MITTQPGAATGAPGASALSAGQRPWVILNATAGKKAGFATSEAASAEDIDALFAALGYPVEVHTTDSAEDAVEVTRSAVAAGCPSVVAAGGDGTLAVVARALLDIAGAHPDDPLPALGIFPLGSAMNVARSLGIPRDLPAAASIIGAGHTRRIDVGAIEGGPAFFEAVAIGLHAELLAEAAAFDEGDWSAALRAAWTAVRYRASSLTLVLDDRTVTTRALVLSISNGPYVGLGFTVAPDARLDDGRFDIRVFERLSRLELLRHFGSIALGRRAYEPRVRTYRSSRVRVEGPSPVRVGVDGDDAGVTPVEARVLPAALRVLVPAP